MEWIIYSIIVFIILMAWGGSGSDVDKLALLLLPILAFLALVGVILYLLFQLLFG